LSPLTITPSVTPATVTDAAWQRRAEDLQLNALPTIRATAEKWAATVGSLTGIFAIAAIIKGPSDITAVQGSLNLLAFRLPWSAVAGILAGAALACASAAIVLASMAAQGTPRRFRFTGIELRRLYPTETIRAAGQLRASRILAVAAIPLLGLASGIVWYTTPAERPAVNVLVTTKTGAVVCGTPGQSSDGLRIKTSHDIETVVPFEDMQTFMPLASCPSSPSGTS
jgi:hypothetical protein